jgi:hypothetical protein
MSQIASFTVLKTSDVPHLGFWSKPKPRLFRKPRSMFEELLRPHVLRERIFDEADAVHVALVFAWIDSLDGNLSKEADPVIDSVRTHVGGSHWLMTSADQRLLALIDRPITETEWAALLRKIDVQASDAFDRGAFDAARICVVDRLSELQPNEAMLVSIG